MGEMRAGHLQENLNAIDALGEDVANRVRARVPTACASIAAALRTSWLDASFDVQLTEALYQEVGADVVRSVNRRAMVQSVNGPLLRAVRDGAVRLFGFTPAAVLRFVPRGWSHIYRSFGVATWDGDAQCLRIAELPRSALDSIGWCEGCAGAIEGVSEVAGRADGAVTLERDADGGTLRLIVRWP